MIVSIGQSPKTFRPPSQSDQVHSTASVQISVHAKTAIFKAFSARRIKKLSAMAASDGQYVSSLYTNWCNVRVAYLIGFHSPYRAAVLGSVM
jgi:hypothetical protein